MGLSTETLVNEILFRSCSTWFLEIHYKLLSSKAITFTELKGIKNQERQGISILDFDSATYWTIATLLVTNNFIINEVELTVTQFTPFTESIPAVD